MELTNRCCMFCVIVLVLKQFGELLFSTLVRMSFSLLTCMNGSILILTVCVRNHIVSVSIAFLVWQLGEFGFGEIIEFSIMILGKEIKFWIFSSELMKFAAC